MKNIIYIASIVCVVFVLSMILVLNQKSEPAISSVSVTPNTNTASLAMSDSKNISWTTSDYPANVGVDINLIKKTSNGLVSYVLVEKIAQNTKNYGSFIWIPKSNQTGSDLYIEITCSTAYQFTGSCTAGAPAKTL